MNIRIDDSWIKNYSSVSERDKGCMRITIRFARLMTYDDRAHVGDIRQMHGAYWKAVSTARTLRGLFKGESSVEWELCDFPPKETPNDN